jgi:DNA-binding response OmpR family regulator
LSAEEAERRFRERPPALAIVELLISGGAGAELCTSLKQLAPVPVLAISSLDAREQAFDAGADAFLQKPLDPLQLVSAVKDLLGQSVLVRGGGP